MADAVRVGDQVSTCGFSARLNRSQSRYHRRPGWPHVRGLDLALTCRRGPVFPKRAVPLNDSVGSGKDPAELTIGQLHEAMAGGKLAKDLAFDHQPVWTCQVDEDGGRILFLSGLGRYV
jgi:hypothetical protein